MTTANNYGIMNLETACSISKGDGRLKVAIYCRLSEEDRNKQTETDDSGSIQNQDGICQGVFLQKLQIVQ